MKLWKTLTGLAILAISVTRCDLGTPPQASPGGGGTEVEGVIVDQHGRPAAGVWVRVYPDSSKPLMKGSNSMESFVAIRDSAKTNASGVFSLPNLPAGTYNLVATMKRNDTTLALFRRSIVISGNANLGTDTLRVSGSMILNVAIQGAIIGGAQCYIPGSPYVTLSDLSGKCTLNGVPPGIYQISVSLAGLPTAQSGDIAVISLQVTDAGTVNLVWVSLPPGVLPRNDTTWPITIAPIPTLFIGNASQAFRDSIAFTPLNRVQTSAYWGGGSSLVGRNFSVGDNEVNPNGGIAQTLTVDLRFVSPSMIPAGGSVRVYDARGTLTHSDSAHPWMNLHQVASKYRRAGVILELPDSVTSSSTSLKVSLKINRIVVRKNGTTVVDSLRSTGFDGLRPHAFVVEYLNPASADSISVLAYGTAGTQSGLLYQGMVKLAPNATTAPQLLMQWVGSGTITVPLCLVATVQPPTLLSPANFATNVSPTTNAVWDSACGAVSYLLQVSNDSAFVSLAVNDSNLTNPTRVLSLVANKIYYWRVAARTSTGWTGFSVARRFTTGSGSTSTPEAPAAPTLISPTNDTVGVPTSATFRWNPSTGATFYRIQVSKDSSFATLYRNDTTTITSRSMGPLDLSTKYYWRVTAVNSLGSATSVTRRFTTMLFVDGVLLAAPVLLQPVDSLQNAPTVPTFSWNAVSGGTQYHLQISTSSSFSPVAFEDSLISGTSRTGFTLSTATTYFWRVRARSSSPNTIGTWSTARRLTTESGSGIPTGLTLYPAGDTTFATLTPVLKWQGAASATSFRVQVSTDSAFIAVLINDTLTGRSITLPSLTNGTRYYWRVQASNSAGTIVSPVHRFLVQTSATLNAPVLNSPAAFATGVAQPVGLTWSTVSSATTYQLQISTSSNFSTAVQTYDSILTTTRSISGLTAGTDYYWRVRARNGTLVSDYSTIRSFTTEAGGVTGTWTPQTSGASGLYAFTMRSSDSLLVAVGAGGAILTTTNGTTWTSRASGVGVSLYGVVWGNNQFVAVGDSGTVLTSPNGSTWTRRSTPVITSLNGIIRDSVNYIAVGNSGYLFYSPDGITWQGYGSGALNNLYSISSGSGKLVVSGAAGLILTAATGVTPGSSWTTRTSPTTNALYAGVWQGSTFILAGAGGTLLRSTDGVIWTSSTSGTTSSLYGLAASGSTIKAVGNGGTILTSTTLGDSWTSEITGYTSNLLAVKRYKSLWVAGGTTGTVFTSP